jgi:hypothetical protein
MEVDPEAAIAKAKAQAAAVRFERQQAAREAMAAKKAAAAATPMDTSEIGTPVSKRLRECPGCISSAPGQQAHTCQECGTGG